MQSIGWHKIQMSNFYERIIGLIEKNNEGLFEIIWEFGLSFGGNVILILQ